MMKILFALVALPVVYCVRAQAAEIVRIPPPQELTIEANDFPDIRLRDVSFLCDGGGYGTCPCFFAAVVFDGSPPWTSLTLNVKTYTSDGKVHAYEVEGEQDDSGTVVKFLKKFIPPFGYKLSEVTRTEVTPVYGTRNELEREETFEGPVADDESCLKDLLKAANTDGLAGRKLLAELIQYGCVKIIKPAARVVVLNKSKAVPEAILITTISADPDQSATGWAMTSGLKESTIPYSRVYPPQPMPK